jgi:hypothetical protein
VILPRISSFLCTVDLTNLRESDLSRFFENFVILVDVN